MRNKWTWIIILVLVLGGFSGVLFNRFVVPWFASLPGLSSLRKLESNNPVVINRREEVQFNDGVDFLALSRQASAFTVSIYSGSAGNYKFLSNGIIASSDGMVLTSKTYLANVNTVTVTTNDGTVYVGQVRALDSRSELAIITISANNLPMAQFADAFDLQASQRLIYIGKSGQEFVHEFAIGTLAQPISNESSLDRVFNSDAFENSITTDAKINADFTGGPVIDLDGKVVGMTNASGGVLISEDLSTAVNAFFANGKIMRPSLGLKYLNLSNALGKLKGLTQGGMLVVSVDEASPTKLAGILPNDLIIAIKNQQLPQSNFEKILNQTSGDLPITILRNGNQMNLTVKLQSK